VVDDRPQTVKIGGGSSTGIRVIKVHGQTSITTAPKHQGLNPRPFGGSKAERRFSRGGLARAVVPLVDTSRKTAVVEEANGWRSTERLEGSRNGAVAQGRLNHQP